MAVPEPPADRYGSRGRDRRLPLWARWLLVGLGAAALLAVTLVGYRNWGSPPIQGEQLAFQVLNDRSVHITLEVQRDDPAEPAACVVRAREVDGAEVGRKEVFVAPSQGTTRTDTMLTTSERPVTGEVYGCTYRVPEYLSTQTGPTG